MVFNMINRLMKRFLPFPVICSMMTASADVVIIGSDGSTPGISEVDVPVGSYIRSDDPGGSPSNNFLLVGELNSNRGSLRGVLSFDLSAIPSGATITSATVSVFQDQATAGRGSFLPVDIEIFSMTGAVTSGSTWSNAAGQFDALLASAPGNTRTVSLNQDFAFSSVALSQYVQNSLAGGGLHLGMKVPALEALSNLPTGEYFIFDGPNAQGYSGSSNSIGPSLRVEFDTPGSETSPDGGVVINEIHSNPEESYELVEFVELYNSKDEDIDLSGWALAGGIDFVFPGGTIIESGKYLVVAEDASVRTLSPTTSVQLKFGADPAVLYGPYAGSLRNEGERIELRDALGGEVDQVDYGQGFPWPLMGEGNSMQLVKATSDNDLGGSWRGALPTPGSANSSVLAANLPPQIRQVDHSPSMPGSTDVVTVSAKIADSDSVNLVELLYQTVPPGNYVRITDGAYNTWNTVTMNDAGVGGDALAGDSIYSVEIPVATRGNRNLIRYRIRATDDLSANVTVPYPDDEQPNFAYMVYDGVPAWNGASNPGGGDAPVSFSTDAMNSMLPYHLIADPDDVADCQFNGAFQENRFKGTLVYEGVVYDHIEFKIRGEGSTYLSGKNKWKFFFNRGHEFEARDDYGKKYAEPWRVLSVSACATPYNANHRGSSGIDEALAFRLFNLAGVPAPRTHYFQFRVIDDAEEASPSSQYEGDLWGLYMATEFPDGRFLDEHGLPDGNSYKMEGSGDKKNQSATQSVNSSDLNSFRASDTSGQSVSWWEANLDLESYFAFRAVNQIVNNLDMSDARNFYWYHNSETDLWTPIPWDMDNAYLHANSNHVRIDALNCLNRPVIKTAYDNYVRSLEDLLFTREQTSDLIDELASIVDPSMVEVDQFMWNYHPRTMTTSVFPHRGGFFRNPATRTSTSGAWSYSRTLASADFDGMKHFFKDFVSPPAGAVTTHNSTWQHWNGWELHASRFSDSGIPLTPIIHYTGAVAFPVDGVSFETTPFNDPGGSFAAMKWRLAEITPFSPPITGPVFEHAKSGEYEIDAIWESGELLTFSNSIEIPSEELEIGKTYRVRCQMKDNSGNWSHWSEAVEFIAGSADVTPWLENLVVSEFMYHPAPPTGGELAVTTSESDFEFLEIWNKSETVSLALGELSFSDGVEFSFGGGAISILGPNEYALVVRNTAAFEARYGVGLPIAGEFSGKLSNDGERVALTFAGGTVIREWTYNDVSPWPVEADGTGASLVLKDPSGVPDHGLAASWMAGPTVGGTPGQGEVVPPVGSFAAWQNEVFTVAELADIAISGAEADPDGDRRSNLLEWAMATDARIHDPSSLELVMVVVDEEERMAVRFKRPEGAVGAAYDLMSSNDLSNWDVISTVPVVEENLGAGIELIRLEDDQAIDLGQNARFLRVRVTLTE